VAETMDIQAETVRVVHPDTDFTPYDMATLGSRSTFHMGHAVKRAAEHARDQLAELADSLGVLPGSNLPWRELFVRKYGMQAGNVIGIGSFKPDYASPDKATGLSENVTPFWMIGGAGVEVEIDTETGEIRVLKLYNAADLGRALNPKVVETQLSGAALMQLGFTLYEDMHLDAGQVTNASFADYKIPGIHDVPWIMGNDIVQTDQTNGPYGSKGVGESTTFGLSPAIANAIHDAVGVRLTELPITPEAILRGIRAIENKG
jgi:CO/xanthine dehydrogenase Mo-binding subunit